MSLEQRVRQEVDSWDVSVRGLNGQPVHYEGLIKPVYYGMGIFVTEKGLKLYSDHMVVGDEPKNYSNLHYDEAVEEFKKDLVIYEYLKRGTAKAAAKVLSVGNNGESGRVILCEILKRSGLTFREISDNPERFTFQYDSRFIISDENVIDNLNNEVKRYSEIVKPILFQRLINDNSRNMAVRFASLSKELAQETFPKSLGLNMDEYSGMTFEEALELFKGNYFRQQFVESGKDGKLAAERAGISYGSYKEHMSRRKIRMRKLK